MGGGGAISVTPFTLENLAVGPIERQEVMAVSGAFPPELEHRFGARIGGLLSHGFFIDCRVTLDFRRMLLIDERASESSDRRAAAAR